MPGGISLKTLWDLAVKPLFFEIDKKIAQRKGRADATSPSREKSKGVNGREVGRAPPKLEGVDEQGGGEDLSGVNSGTGKGALKEEVEDSESVKSEAGEV